MKNIVLFFSVLLHLPVFGQPNEIPNRKQEIEILTEPVYLATEFRRIADSLQMSVNELSDYPVISPVKHPVISSGFGIRRHPVYKVWKFHTGIDFAKVKGTPVYATGSGVVVRKGYNSGYGNFIEIQHAGGFRSFYAHLSKILVSAGDTVRMGKHIACVGNSGLTTGYHLHYEIRKGNRFLNPAEWCCCLAEMLKAELSVQRGKKIVNE
jgi:murein DD-endopeptidase MepM/ murein hydrolase activator NlpD